MYMTVYLTSEMEQTSFVLNIGEKPYQTSWGFIFPDSDLTEVMTSGVHI